MLEKKCVSLKKTQESEKNEQVGKICASEKNVRVKKMREWEKNARVNKNAWVEKNARALEGRGLGDGDYMHTAPFAFAGDSVYVLVYFLS